MRKVLLDTSATMSVALALALAGCGGDDGAEPASQATPPAQVTPVPSQTAVATPEEDHGPEGTPDVEPTGTPTPTATPDTGGAEAGELEDGGQGDEAGVRVPVAVTITADRIRANEATVAAFLPLRFTVRNRQDRELQVVVVRSGEGGGTVGRGTAPAGGTTRIDVDGLRPGSLEVLSPDLDPDMTAIVAVEPGG